MASKNRVDECSVEAVALIESVVRLVTPWLVQVRSAWNLGCCEQNGEKRGA